MFNRLSKDGMTTNKYYNDDQYSAYDGYERFGCTWYVFGRSAEASGQSVKRGYCANPMLKRDGWGNAKEFYNDANWQKGSTPKKGAIACWGSSNDKYGHVAFVERVNEDGSILVSQSNWHGNFFETKNYICNVGKVTNGVGYTFNGYLYNPFIDQTETERDDAKDQVLVIADMLRVRTIEGDWLNGLYWDKQLYTFNKIVEKEGLKWLVINDYMLAQNDEDEWTITYKAKELTEVERLRKENEELKEELLNLKKGLECLYNAI